MSNHTEFHATMIDETGSYFSAQTDAVSKEAARDYFRENYPESRLVGVQTRAEIMAEENDRYDRARRDDY